MFRQLNVTAILSNSNKRLRFFHGKNLGVSCLYKTQFKFVFAIRKIAELLRNLSFLLIALTRQALVAKRIVT